MYYRINVAKRIEENAGKPFGPFYTHFFATADNSITEQHQLVQVYDELVKAFPDPHYKVAVTHWTKSGRDVNVETIRAELERQK